MKKLLLLTILGLILLLPSCKNSSSSDSNDNLSGDNSFISRLNITNTSTTKVKELCSSTYKASITRPDKYNNRGYGGNNDIEVVSYFDNGELKPFIFNNKKGEKFIFSAEACDLPNSYPIVTKLCSPYIAFRYSTIYKVEESSSIPHNLQLTDISSQWGDKWGGNHVALVNITTGKFYDFSNFSLYNIKSDENNIYAFGTGYRGGDSLFKIDKNTLKATQLTNPYYVALDIRGFHFMIDNDRMVYSYVQSHNYEHQDYVLFTDTDRHIIPLESGVDSTKYEQDHTDATAILDNSKMIPVIMRTSDNKLIIAIVNKTESSNNETHYYLYTGELKLNTDSTVARFELINLKETKDGNNRKEIEMLPNDYYIHSFFSNEVHDNKAYTYQCKLMIPHEDYFYFSNNKDIYKVTYENNQVNLEKKTVPSNITNYVEIYNSGDNFILTNNQTIEFYNFTTGNIKTILSDNTDVIYTSITPENLIYVIQTDRTTTQTYKLSLQNGTVGEPVKYQAKVKDLVRLDF